jgi:hypothetical protein
MDKFLDKLCDLIVKCARFINALVPLMIVLAAAYFIGMFIVAMIIR